MQGSVSCGHTVAAKLFLRSRDSRASKSRTAPVWSVVAAHLRRSRRTSCRALHFRFCEICGNGTGVVPCSVCLGSGKTSTEPGGAGKPFYVGVARCRYCNGLWFRVMWLVLCVLDGKDHWMLVRQI
ncbi:TPA: hypothetical protein ACH3X1_003726 [Trebouxia sp. C0004]